MILNKKRYLLAFLQLALAGTGLSVLVLAAFFLYLSPDLPSVDSIRDVRLQTPLRIYSADNKLIGEFGDMRRNPVKLKDVPQTFIDALLAAEDAEFYSHHGVSIKGLLRAVVQLITTGRKSSGGSTLTMQLTRHIFFTLEKKFSRKFNEIILAMKLERELTKDEILELYINYMYLGNRAYGVQAAAEVYYGKDLKDLSVAQMATLAASFQLPSKKNAIVDPAWTEERRNWILGRMYDLGKIDEKTYQQALSEKEVATYHGNQYDVNAPYVAELVREKAVRMLGAKAYTDGYKVFTTIDSRLQLNAQKALIDGLLTYDKRHGYHGPEQKLDPTLLSGQSDAAAASAEADSTTSEQQDPPTDASPTPADDSTVAATNDQTDYSAWLKALEDIPIYGGLIPAAVTSVGKTDLKLLLRDGTHADLPWDDELSAWRKRVDVNHLGPRAQSPADLFAVGDVVRLRESGPHHYVLAEVPQVQGAFVSLDPSNGAILSLVGGFDFFYSHFNRVTQAYRQPGSNFKPFLYTAALENGLTAATLINDAPIVFDDAQLEGTWRPENDSGKFYGPTRLRKALYMSRNMVSIRLLREIGINTVRDSLDRFGFDSKSFPRDLSLALGSHVQSPLQMVQAFATFANDGYHVEAYSIERIEDLDGRVLFQAMPLTVCESCEQQDASDGSAPEAQAEPGLSAGEESANPEASAPTQDSVSNEDPDFASDAFAIPIDIKSQLGILEPSDFPRAQQVIDPNVVFIIDSFLKDVIRKGTGVRARALNRSDLAGKTGTTNGPTDAWFSGYNRRIVATAWVGFDQNTPLGNREYGGTAALPIWIEFMRQALQGMPETSLKQPPGVVTVRINPDTGKRASVDDPDGMFEYFLRGTVPEQEDSPPNGQATSGEINTDEIF